MRLTCKVLFSFPLSNSRGEKKKKKERKKKSSTKVFLMDEVHAWWDIYIVDFFFKSSIRWRASLGVTVRLLSCDLRVKGSNLKTTSLLAGLRLHTCLPSLDSTFMRWRENSEKWMLLPHGLFFIQYNKKKTCFTNSEQGSFCVCIWFKYIYKSIYVSSKFHVVFPSLFLLYLIFSLLCKLD